MKKPGDERAVGTFQDPCPPEDALRRYKARLLNDPHTELWVVTHIGYREYCDRRLDDLDDRPAYPH